MRKLDHGPAAPKIARPSIHPNPSSRFRRTSIAPPTDDSQITQHRIPTLKSDRLLGRIGRSGIGEEESQPPSLARPQARRRRQRHAPQKPAISCRSQGVWPGARQSRSVRYGAVPVPRRLPMPARPRHQIPELPPSRLHARCGRPARWPPVGPDRRPPVPPL